MLYIFLQFISLCIVFRHYISSFFMKYTGQTIVAYGICILISIALIMGYKIEKIGYAIKVLVSASMSYNIVRVLNWFIEGFVQDNNILFADLIVLVIGTIIFSKITIERTENSWLDSDCWFNYQQSERIKDFFSIKHKERSSAVSKNRNHFFIKRLSVSEFNSMKEKLDYYERNNFVSKNSTLQTENQNLRTELEHVQSKNREMQSSLDECENLNIYLRKEVERIRFQMEKGGTDIFFVNCKNQQEIKERYRKLSAIYHPDCSCGDTAVFQQIQGLYDKLC